jgi:ABC-type nitrate/sulfonate/bicarbonate transport system substrate-binding protein
MLKRIVLIVVLVISALPGVFSASCQQAYSGPVESITVAYSPFESTGLLWVAIDRNFFIRNGLDVTLLKYDTGSGALDGIGKGEADLVVGTTEYPVVSKAFKNENVRIFASLDTADYIYLVGRKDRGIEKVSDLKGKKVGTTIGTLAHFYLGSLLDLNNINMEDITLIDLKTPEEWVNAVANGDIDAVVTAQPYANYAADRLGDNAYKVSAQSKHLLYSLAISTGDWIARHGEAANRFLKSLLQAQDYLESHPNKAKAIIKEGLNLDVSYIETMWSQNMFSLSLDQSLILSMEDEARWMIDHNLTTEKTVPNFLDYIYTDALKNVKPDAVSIVR